MRIAIFTILCLCSLGLLSQNHPSPTQSFGFANSVALCHSDEHHQQQMKNDARYRLRQNDLSRKAYQYISQNQGAAKRQSGPYRLPIVVHIVHDNGLENISEAQVQTAIQHLNDAFANRGYYDPQTGANTDIEFCLAQQDPDENLTNGIERVQSSLTDFNMVTSNNDLKLLSQWDSRCYINIWVVREIRNSLIGDGVAGYATLPPAHGSATDGIVVEAAYFGTTEANSAVTVHEMGHYLGLYHTFQGGCGNDDCLLDGDQVCDTPPDQTTAAAPCGFPVNSCNTDAQSGLASDLPDMTNNYMDYGFQACFNAFTAGQVERMHFFLETTRKSLTECPSCRVPCNNPIVTQVDVDRLSIQVGEQLTFDNQTQGASRFEWYVNDSLVSTAVNLSYLFDKVGSFKVRLEASDQTRNCVGDTTICIDVDCSVNSLFSNPVTACLDLGDQVTFVNQSLAAPTYEWFVDGVLVSNDRDLDYTFNTAGTFRIQLITSNNLCRAASPVAIVRVLCLEICDNGLDDDGDGLVDCFDDDCCNSCTDHYYTACADSCAANISSQPVIQARPRRINFPITYSEFNNIIAGDIDQDGVVEVVGAPTRASFGTTRLPPFIVIYEPNTGNIQQRLLIPGYFFFESQSPVLADIDRDGFAEIFTTAVRGDNGGLSVNYFPVCFKWNGSSYELDWISASGLADNRAGNVLRQYGYENLSAADFDGDGKTELYSGNQIWDAETGRLLTSGGPNNSIGTYQIAYTRLIPQAIDVLPDDYCANCSGLELVAGNQVYSVGQAPNWSLQVEVELPNQIDGFTSVVDFDLDGDLDAVTLIQDITSGFSIQVFVWDIQTPTTLAPVVRIPGQFNRGAYFSAPVIGPLDDDGFPDLAFLVLEGQGFGARVSQLYAFSGRGNRWEPIFDRSLPDRSGVAGCSLFDFNADGKSEIMFRGERTFQIISSENGDILYEDSDRCQSFTSWEFPIVVDIDNDKEAEVLIGCEGDLNIYESDGIAWPDTRNLWNQFSYFNVNVNDDLTIPQQQQSPHLLDDPFLNSFLQQYPFAPTDFPDLELSLIDIDSCTSVDSQRITLRLCNTGDVLIDSIYLTAYESDPQTDDASIVEQFNRSIRLSPSTCVDIEFVIDTRGLNGLWFVANDDGTAARPYQLDGSFTGFALECNFANNLVSLFPLPDPIATSRLDLGPDQVICDNGVFTFEASDQFESYRWQDGSTDRRFTTDRTGTFFLTVQDACGNEQSDTVRVTADPATIIDLGADQLVCPGASISLQADGYSRYQWIPDVNLDCDTCSNVTAQIQQAITYTVVGINANGCIGVDSIRIELRDSILRREFVEICEGDSALVFGQYIQQSGTYEQAFQTANGCDSTEQVILEVLPSPIVQDSLTICPGDSALIFGIWRSTAGTFAEDFALPSGCDSTQITTLQFYPGYLNTNVADLCQGDTLVFQGLRITSGGTYQQVYSSSNGCDSIEQIQVNMRDTFFQSDLLQICQGDSTLVFGQYTRQSGTFEQSLQTIDGCDSTRQITVQVLAAPITRESLTICPSDSALLFGIWRSIPGSYTETFALPNGCDSTHTIDLSLYPNYLNSGSTDLCQGDTLFFQGLTIIDGGVYQQVYSSINGCDSVEQIQINLRDTFFQSDLLQICQGDSALVFGQYTQQSGTFEQSLQTIDGCDSTRQITVQVLAAPITRERLTICPSDSALLFGIWQSIPGSYTETFALPNGCDSTHTIDLSLYPNYLNSGSADLCQGDTLFFQGLSITDGGEFQQVYSSINGCDSVEQIQVNLRDTFFQSDLLQICQGDSVLVFGQYIRQSGTFEQSLQTTDGCDSTRQITVDVLASPITQENLIICPSDSAFLFGQWQSTPGSYTETFVLPSGCDSTHTIDLSLYPDYLDGSSADLCQGDTLLFQGLSITEGGVFQQVYSSINGCDSIEQVQVNLKDTFLQSDLLQICQGDSVLVFGQYIQQGGVYEQLLQSTEGCDSTIQIRVDVQATPVTQESLRICPSDSVFLFGQWQSAPGSYTGTFVLPNGCDSTHTVALDLYPDYVNDSSTELCQGDTLFLWGRAIADEGFYQQFFTSINGCDSVERVEVTLIPSVEKVDSLWLCPGEFYVFDNDTIRQAGTYTRELVALGGQCDTIDVLVVDIYQELSIEAITSTGCEGGNSGSIEIIFAGQDIQYSLDGNTYVSSLFFDNLPAGPQTIFAQDANGCRAEADVFIEERLPLSVDLPRDTAVQEGNYIQLEASINNAVGELRYDWQPADGLSCDDCPTPFLQVTQDASYVLWVQDEDGCSASDTIQIAMINAPQAFIPNVFSPNGDNINDRLTVFGGSDLVQVLQFQIFNRWGGLVFEQNNFPPNDFSLGWDGTFRGDLLNSGVYVYKAEVEFASGQLVMLSGSVTLLR